MDRDNLLALAAELAEAHQDAQEAARVTRLAQAAAGTVLLRIRDSMPPKEWSKWLVHQCPVPRALVGRYVEAAEAVAKEARTA